MNTILKKSLIAPSAIPVVVAYITQKKHPSAISMVIIGVYIYIRERATNPQLLPRNRVVPMAHPSHLSLNHPSHPT